MYLQEVFVKTDEHFDWPFLGYFYEFGLALPQGTSETTGSEYCDPVTQHGETLFRSSRSFSC